MSLSNNWFNHLIHNFRERNRKERFNRRNRLRVEPLESRAMLAGDMMDAMEIDMLAMDTQMTDVGHEHTAPANMSSMKNGSHTGHHAGHQAAHPAAMALISTDQATNMVVASGDWSDPNVWENGALPEAGARIIISEGMILTVNSVIETKFKTIGIHGTLRFATDVNTELRVDTVVSAPNGRFEMGTAANPIDVNVTAKVVFADDGTIDTNWDPEQLSRGAVLQGPTEIHGAETTHRVTLASHPAAGAVSIELSSLPSGWNVGDDIVITGTQGSTSDEVRTIASISGSTVTLNRALELDHIAPKSDLNVYVANTTRNVRFSSENAAVPNRGHIMFMHTLDVNVHNAEFTDLGRTDKNRPLDDVFFDFDGDAVGNETSAGTVFTTTPGPGTNVRGRYAIHFHRGGVDPNSTAAVVGGSVVNGSPGWGFVNHSANVDMVDNVAYGVQGAAFYTEAGDEIGSLVGNIAIRTVSPTFTLDDEGAIDPDLRGDVQDFGVDGEGFWLSGHLVSMRNNVSAGASAHGIIIWSDGLVEADTARGRASVKVSDIENGHLVTGRDTIPTWWAPLAEISNNESYGATIGFRSRYVHSAGYLGEIGSNFHTPPDQAYIDTLNPTIDGLTVWGSRDGVLFNYNERMSLKNARIIGVGAAYVQNGGTADTGVGLDMYNEVTRGPGVIENVSIEGFNMGFLAPRNDSWQITNLNLQNTTDMLITEVRQGARVLDMTNVVFGDLAGTAVAGNEGQRQNIVMQPEFDADAHQPFFFLLSDRITLDGQQIYFDEQAPNYVPLERQIEHEGVRIPEALIGATNQTLMTNHGTSFGGAITPEDAVEVSWVSSGLVGSISPSAATYPPLYHMASEGAGAVLLDPGTLTNFDGPLPGPGANEDSDEGDANTGGDNDPDEGVEDTGESDEPEEGNEELGDVEDSEEDDQEPDDEDDNGVDADPDEDDEDTDVGDEDSDDSESNGDDEEGGEAGHLESLIEQLGSLSDEETSARIDALEFDDPEERQEVIELVDEIRELSNEGLAELEEDEREEFVGILSELFGDNSSDDNDEEPAGEELGDEDEELGDEDEEVGDEEVHDEGEADGDHEELINGDDQVEDGDSADEESNEGGESDEEHADKDDGEGEKNDETCNEVDTTEEDNEGDSELGDAGDDITSSGDGDIVGDEIDDRVDSDVEDSLEEGHDNSSLREAFALDQRLGLTMDGSYYENWGGMGEKWLRADGGDWYFIMSGGEFYQWDGNSDLTTSELVATLDASCYEDPSTLHDAQDPTAGSQHDESTSSTQADVSIQQVAFTLDQDLGLRMDGSYYENWGGIGEKWMRAAAGDWYFITSGGGFYRWNGDNDLSTSELVATLDSSCYDDPSLLHDAPNPNAVADGDVQSTPLAEAISEIRSLGLYSNGSYYENWGGMNEKWMLSADRSWYFITETGALYVWDGGTDLSTSLLVASLDSSCYADPTCLFDTANV